MTTYCGGDSHARQQTVCSCDTVGGASRLGESGHQADDVRGSYSRSAGGRKVAAYAGLDPTGYSSGDRQRFGPISKGGSRLPRDLLAEAARITATPTV